jgi:hypothetical protein
MDTVFSLMGSPTPTLRRRASSLWSDPIDAVETKRPVVAMLEMILDPPTIEMDGQDLVLEIQNEAGTTSMASPDATNAVEMVGRDFVPEIQNKVDMTSMASPYAADAVKMDG